MPCHSHFHFIKNSANDFPLLFADIKKNSEKLKDKKMIFREGKNF